MTKNHLRSSTMPSKGRKRESAPDLLQGSTPNGEKLMPPPRRPPRRASLKARSVTESQDTLTQMDFVFPVMSSFDGHHSDNVPGRPASSGKKRQAEVPDSDEERVDAPRKKARSASKSVAFEIRDSEDEEEELPSRRLRKSGRYSDFERKRQETLTQMDFAKSLRGEMSDGCAELEILESNDVLVAGANTNVVEYNEAVLLVQTEPAIEQPGRNPKRTKGSKPVDSDTLPAPKPIPRTPKKFKGKEIVPSSQSPADSTLSTQKTPQKQRSPLANRSLEHLMSSPAKSRSMASPLQERSPNLRKLSISPTKFHVRQFNARMAEALKPIPRTNMIGSSAENSKVKNLLEDVENKTPRANETCFDAGAETQAVLISSAIAFEANNEDNDPENSSHPTEDESEEKIAESPVKICIVKELQSEIAETTSEPLGGIPTSQYPDARTFWQHEPSWRPESTDTYFAYIKDVNTQDSASAQLHRETQAYNERIASSQDEETERVPSSQETPMPPPSIHAMQFQQTSVHGRRESQQSTIGTSLALTPRRSQRFQQSSLSKHSVIEIHSSPSKQSTVVIPSSPSVKRMAPPPVPGCSQFTPKSRRIRDLRRDLLEHDYEDDPVSVSQLLGQTMGESVGMPPPLSSPADAQ